MNNGKKDRKKNSEIKLEQSFVDKVSIIEFLFDYDDGKNIVWRYIKAIGKSSKSIVAIIHVDKLRQLLNKYKNDKNSTNYWIMNMIFQTHSEEYINEKEFEYSCINLGDDKDFEYWLENTNNSKIDLWSFDSEYQNLEKNYDEVVFHELDVPTNYESEISLIELFDCELFEIVE